MKQLLSKRNQKFYSIIKRNLFIFRAAGGQIKRDYEYRTFEGGKFDDKGFLIKNFPLPAIVS
jgi:hypothetical protein